MSFEKEPVKKEKSLSEIEAEMKERGYVFAGEESLTVIRLNSKEGRFIAEKFRTKEDIIKKYVGQYKNQVDVEVELIEAPNLKENQEAVWVFIKKKE